MPTKLAPSRLLCLVLLLESASGFAPGLIARNSAPKFGQQNRKPTRPSSLVLGLRLTATGGRDVRKAGPDTPAPVYTDSSFFDRKAIQSFRDAMVQNLGDDVPEQGFPGLMKLTLMLNRKFGPREVQKRARSICLSLFPPFMIKAFPILFAGPFPAFSAKLNAFVTSLTCKWLMGPQKLYDLDPSEVQEGWGDGRGQGILIERCRFLEESGCASVCVNSCKVPTQEFFARDMGVLLWMEPDYDTFECRFKFGAQPPPQKAEDVFKTPCFTDCPSKKKQRHPVSQQQLCPFITPDETYNASIPSTQEFVQRLFARHEERE